MNFWKMKTPDIVINGSGSIKFLDEILDDNNKKRPFIVIDNKLKETKFFYDICEKLAKYDSFFWSDFTTDPLESSMEEGSKRYISHKADSIIAIGGGSAIDSAKIIGLLGETKFTLEDCYRCKSTKESFPFFVSVPTTCGTGAESSPYAIVSNNSIPKKIAIEREFFIPSVVILDPDSLKSLEKKFIAATSFDTLIHSIELHTAKTSNNLVRIQTRGSLLSLGKYMEAAIFERSSEALEGLQNIAFTARLLYPRTGLSIAHGIAHPLGAFTGIHHGMAVSLVMPEVIRFNKEASPGLFDEVADILGISKLGSEGIAIWIEKVLKLSGIIECLKNQLKNKDIDIKKIANHAMKSSNIRSNPRDIKSVKELEEILEKSLFLIK